MNIADEEVCALGDAPKGSFNPLALMLPGDGNMTQFLNDAEKAEDAEKAPTPEAKKEWKAAMGEYVEAQKQMQSAQGRLMKAMSAMLEVEAVDTPKLNALVEKKEKDLLVVFYAPWCPHCQSFVLHDGKGNPEEAPLEIFNRNVHASGANKTLSVLRFDVDANREGGMPAGFEAKYIPTIYLAAADGKKVQFKSNKVDSASLVDFIEKNSAKTKKIGKASQTIV